MWTLCFWSTQDFKTITNINSYFKCAGEDVGLNIGTYDQATLSHVNERPSFVISPSLNERKSCGLI